MATNVNAGRDGRTSAELPYAVRKLVAAARSGSGAPRRPAATLVRVIVSLMYQVARKLRAVPGVLLRRDLAKEAELLVLRHENAVLRRQLTGPARYDPADRLWLAALSSLIPRHRWAQVFPVTPATLLAWHRRLVTRKWDYSTRRRRRGRPPTASAVKAVALRLGQGESALGLPPHSGRTRAPRASHRRHDCLGDPYGG